MKTNRRDFIKGGLGTSVIGYLGANEAFAGSELGRGNAQRQTLLDPFNYKGVTLDDGPLRRQFDEIRNDYLRIPNDDLLMGFRQRAGLPAPGVDLGGWYTRDTFHIFGQILGGLARMYAATGDPDCRAKLDALILEWAKTIGPDGYFYYTVHPNAPHYTYEKMVGGLVDAGVYGGSADALPLLSRITDWAIKNLSRDRVYSFNAGAGNTEWYTLSENLYRAYLATGDDKYRDFAAVWEYTEYWNLYAQKQDIFTPFGRDQAFASYHAYSHVNGICGAGAAYRVKGDAHYLDTLKNAYDYLTTYQTYATGGFGPGEHLMPPADLPQALYRLTSSFETQCGSWAVFKLAKYLISFTGDARFGDWMELALINGIGASIPMAADGRVFYYSNYNIEGGRKVNHPEPWSCCNGTRPMAAADFHDLIYFKDADGLYMNLFTPSTVQWGGQGAKVTLRQRTRFPEEDKVEFTVSAAAPRTFALSFRTPGWLASPMSASLNGKPLELEHTSRHWATVKREWHDGDRIALTLPAKFSLSPLRGAGGQFPAAIMRGPVTFALRSPSGDPSTHVDFDRLETSFNPNPGEALTYHLVSDPSVLVRPFYAFKEGEPYHVYLHPDLANWIAKWQCTLSDDWHSFPWFAFSTKEDSTAQHTFEGTGIRWKGFRFEDGGKAEVSIDGTPVEVVDQYGPAHPPATPPVGPSMPFEWTHSGLAVGKHTLTIKVLAENNPASKGKRITIAEFEAA